MTLGIRVFLLFGIILLSTVLLARDGLGPTGPGVATLPDGEPREEPGTPQNTAPQVGVTAELTQAAVLQLSGSALDTTLPEGQLTTRWTQVSGPGPVEFADPSKVDTSATFTVPGTYVLRLVATDGEFTVSDDVTVEVRP